MHPQSTPWAGLAENSFFHLFNRYLLSPYYVPSFHLPRGTSNTALLKYPYIDSVNPQSFCFILERWEDNSGLGQSSTRCLGGKKAAWNQGGTPTWWISTQLSKASHCICVHGTHSPAPKGFWEPKHCPWLCYLGSWKGWYRELLASRTPFLNLL